MFAWLFYNSNAQLLSLQLQPFGFYAVVKKTSKERYNIKFWSTVMKTFHNLFV